MNRHQKLTLTPNWAANGIPTVVPGPKKSPKAPASTRSWFKLVIGFVMLQSGLRQNAVALARLLTGVGNAERLVTKLAPGLLRLNRLKNSASMVTFQRSLNANGRVTRISGPIQPDGCFFLSVQVNCSLVNPVDKV